MIGAARKAEIASRDARIVAAYRRGELQASIGEREGIVPSMVSIVLRKHGARLAPHLARARMMEAGHNPAARKKAAETNSRPLIDRFLEKLTKGTSPGACWIWHGCTDSNGYPQIIFEGKKVHASHAALLLNGRPRPGDLYALHTCDTPLCVNPDHLWWGTQKENIQDALAKGRLDLSGLALGLPARLSRVEVEIA